MKRWEAVFVRVWAVLMGAAIGVALGSLPCAIVWRDSGPDWPWAFVDPLGLVGAIVGARWAA